MHRLDRRSGGIEALQNLVAQRYALVVAQHAVFDTPDPLRKAVGVETGHRGHAQYVARLAIHHHRRPALEPDPACGVILQRTVDRQPDGIALDVLARFQVADDPSRCGDLDPACARDAAQIEFELAFQRILADLVPRRDQQRIAILLLILLGIRRTDIAEQMADSRPGGIEAREAALRNHPGQVGQAHADRGELVIADTRGDLDGLVAGTVVDPLADVRRLVLVELEDIGKRQERGIGVGRAFGYDIDAEVRAVRCERRPVAVEDPATPRRDQR